METSFTRRMNSWATLPLVMTGTVVGVMVLQYIFTFTVNCDCGYRVAVGAISLVGPPLLVLLWAGQWLRRMCRSQSREEKEFNLRGAAVMMVAGFTWLVVALLNQRLLCCMLPFTLCCQGVSQLAGVILMVVATLIMFLMLNVHWTCSVKLSVDDVEDTRPHRGRNAEHEMLGVDPSKSQNIVWNSQMNANSGSRVGNLRSGY